MQHIDRADHHHRTAGIPTGSVLGVKRTYIPKSTKITIGRLQTVLKPIFLYTRFNQVSDIVCFCVINQDICLGTVRMHKRESAVTVPEDLSLPGVHVLRDLRSRSGRIPDK